MVSSSLPAGAATTEVAEGPVRLGHLVGVLAPLDGGAEAVHGVDELDGELLAHGLAAALAGGLDQPAHAERHAAIAADLDRDLVGGATDAARLDLDDRAWRCAGPARGPRGRGGAADASARASAWRRMRSARPFLPSFMSLTTKRSVVRVEGRRVLGLARDLRSSGMRHLLGPLGAVQRAALLAVADAGGIERAADDVVLDRRAGP